MLNNDFIFTDYARKLIRFKARQLCRSHNLSKSDEEELKQDLWLAIIANADKFDPERGAFNTFIDRVVNTAIAMLLRDRQRQKRANELRFVSLDHATSDFNCEPLSANVSEAELAQRVGTEPIDEVDHQEITEAVEAALAKMPDELRDICKHVMDGSISSAAREMELSRRQIRNALAAARYFLEEAGVR